MPTINRIRIINFSYNNDTRHIMDECFNFHGGTMPLNLANGGAKASWCNSFCSRLFPESNSGRNIAGFFRTKTTDLYPAEWKLDGGGGYLLTGLAMVPVESTPDEEISRKYVTYLTCKYHDPMPLIFFTSRWRRKEEICCISFLKEARS